tara:strand:+ start:314 stop:754 length:441 start_codon:yes stop_codon:yes gene_type:complete
MAFKMKGHTLPGINQNMDDSSQPDGRAKSSAFQKDTDPVKKPKRTESVSDEQTVVDNENIAKSTNQPMQGMSTDADHKDNVNSVKRQVRIDTSNMSKKDIKKELKTRSKTGVNKSEKLDVGLLGRLFGSKKKLASKLAHQKNVSDI